MPTDNDPDDRRMTRQVFAALAMTGLLAREGRQDPYSHLAYHAVQASDALIAKLDADGGSERVLVDFDPQSPSQRERIATQLLAASTMRNGLDVDSATAARERVSAALRNADMLIESLNQPKDTLT